jgi:hypothetical protein
VFAVITLGLGSVSFLSAQESRATFYGQPGSYILDGAEESYEDGDGLFEIEEVFGWTIISFSGVTPSDWWSLGVGGAGGAPLSPGLYLDASRDSSSSNPRLDLAYQGRGCNIVRGWFEVLELERDTHTGMVTSIAVQFEHYCESMSAAVMGQVRFQSDLPYTDPFAAVRLYLATQDATLPDGRDEVNYSSPLTSLTEIQFPGAEVAFAADTADAETWFFGFASGTPSPLVVGEYGGAVDPGQTAPDRPRLLARRSDQNCDNSDGRFEVLEYRFDNLGMGLHFAATFEIYCEEALGPLHGQIRFDSPVPDSPRRVPTLIFAWGDWMPPSEEVMFTDGDSYFTLARNHDDSILVWGERVGNGSEHIHATFAGPDGAPVQVGHYPDAERYPFASPGHPQMDISMNHSGCNTLTGEFTVHEIEVDGTGDPTRLAIDFVQYCEGTPPPLVGQIRYRSDVAAPPVFRDDFDRGHLRPWSDVVRR